MDNNFIPIEMIDGTSDWYMDISKLSLSELIDLRDNFSGTETIRILDRIIYSKSDITFDLYQNLSKREYLRNKEISLKGKTRSKKLHKRRK